MNGASAFSENYVTARERFIAAANGLGCPLEQYSIGEKGPGGEDLTIDVAHLGEENPSRVVVVSSGLHGVEGFFGSAVQLALLDGLLHNWSPAPSTAIVLLHALNPFGFAWLRRFNEENVDLNRNFFLEKEEYSGSPKKYAELNDWLNPKGVPPPVSLFYPEALWHIVRNGLPTMKEVIVGGQYDFPEGLFSGAGGHRSPCGYWMSACPNGSARPKTCFTSICIPASVVRGLINCWLTKPAARNTGSSLRVNSPPKRFKNWEKKQGSLTRSMEASHHGAASGSPTATMTLLPVK